MIGIDTNVLVRYLVQDDKLQSAKATKFIEGKLSAETPGIVNHIVLIELVWVLESCYQTTKLEVVQILETIIATKQLYVQDIDIIQSALRLYQSSSIDFSDALIGAVNITLGCKTTVTFDKKAAKQSLFETL